MNDTLTLSEARTGPGFDHVPPRTGYVWWYVDALSDDGAHGITLIAFIGSVFSPYYAWARRRGGGDPLAHCALNVAIYGRGRRWAMTERGAAALMQSGDALAIGNSQLAWDGTGLDVRIDEVSVPLPRRVRGRLRLYPAAVESRTRALDAGGRHWWRPIAPCARVEVALPGIGLSWSGSAYFDSNWGERPLEADFARWEWSRAPVQDGTVVLYDVVRRAGEQGLSLAMRYDRAGGVEDFLPPARQALPATRWRMPRSIGSEPGEPPAVIKTYEDTPFYARSVVRTKVLGEKVTAFHESLSLDRFRRLWVQAMLPFRMPRAL